MALNIKNPHAEALAKKLVQLTGETKTQAVIQALQERLDRIQRETSQKSRIETLRKIARECAALPVLENNKSSLVDDILEIGRQCDMLPELDDRTADEILGYDEDGLPS